MGWAGDDNVPCTCDTHSKIQGTQVWIEIGTAKQESLRIVASNVGSVTLPPSYVHNGCITKQVTSSKTSSTWSNGCTVQSAEKKTGESEEAFCLTKTQQKMNLTKLCGFVRAEGVTQI